jgi:hypothetical protein
MKKQTIQPTDPQMYAKILSLRHLIIKISVKNIDLGKRKTHRNITQSISKSPQIPGLM